MQRVQKQHGRVSVAYLTSGDGYVDGVELETHRLKPRPQDFVDYGERRLHEALRALQAISVSQKRLFAFGFPDGGLLDLLTTSWSSATPFVSPYTHDDRPPYALSMSRDAAYSGVALERELVRLIVRLSPDWIAVTGPWDIHPDHCAAFHFVVRALRRLSSSNPDFVVAPSPRLHGASARLARSDRGRGVAGASRGIASRCDLAISRVERRRVGRQGTRARRIRVADGHHGRALSRVRAIGRGLRGLFVPSRRAAGRLRTRPTGPGRTASGSSLTAQRSFDTR